MLVANQVLIQSQKASYQAVVELWLNLLKEKKCYLDKH